MQDQLLLHGIITFTTENVVLFIASCKSSLAAWNKIAKLYAKKSWSRMMNLRENLASPKGSRTMSDYFQLLRSLADYLALISSPINEDDLVIHAMNAIGLEFKEIFVGIQAQETKISFELLDKLLDFESFHKKREMPKLSLILSANFASRDTKPANKLQGQLTKNNSGG